MPGSFAPPRTRRICRTTGLPPGLGCQPAAQCGNGPTPCTVSDRVWALLSLVLVSQCPDPKDFRRCETPRTTPRLLCCQQALSLTRQTVCTNDSACDHSSSRKAKRDTISFILEDRPDDLVADHALATRTVRTDRHQIAHESLHIVQEKNILKMRSGKVELGSQHRACISQMSGTFGGFFQVNLWCKCIHHTRSF